MNCFLGAVVTVLMSAHFAGVMISHVRANAAWEFRWYGLLLFGAAGCTAGVVCLRSGVSMLRGNPSASRAGLWASAAIVAIYTPLIPIQPAALILALAAAANAVLLTSARRAGIAKHSAAAAS